MDVHEQQNQHTDHNHNQKNINIYLVQHGIATFDTHNDRIGPVVEALTGVECDNAVLDDELHHHAGAGSGCVVVGAWRWVREAAVQLPQAAAVMVMVRRAVCSPTHNFSQLHTASVVRQVMNGVIHCHDARRFITVQVISASI